MTHIEPQAREPKKHVKINTASVKTGKHSLVQSGICVGIRLSEGAVYLKLWLWAGMQSKTTLTMILTRSSSEHDGEQVDSHSHGVKDWQGLQSIRHRVFLQGQNREPVQKYNFHRMNRIVPFCGRVTVDDITRAGL